MKDTLLNTPETPDTTPKNNVLVIASHPHPERSIINKALQQMVQDMAGVTYRNLEDLYGVDTTQIDVDTERSTYDGIDTVVFMYPLHWFNLTPMLKAYFNEVWFPWAPQALKGVTMFEVVTAGAPEVSFSREGGIGLTIDEVLYPMKAAANHAGLKYLPPLAFFQVAEGKLETYQKQLEAKFRAVLK